MFGRHKSLTARVQALTTAVEASEGRVDPEVWAAARTVVDRVGARLAFSGDVTVVALGGATGSGKSSLFNAITGTRLAEPGVRRPTTSNAMSASFGEAHDDILDWLDVPRRHLVTGVSELDGLVLLDLPDHDSTEVSHRLIVDRLVELVDLLVWVVDPQKYADSALHDGYLRRLATHADVMMIAVNQVDKLPEAERGRLVKDLRRILDDEGLKETKIVPVSAATGIGIPQLRATLAKLISSKQAAAKRLEADVDVAAKSLAAEVGDAKAGQIGKQRLARLNSTLGVAAGVPVVVEAVAKSVRHRGALATGWPVVAWLGKFRPDPLRALRLDITSSAKQKAIEPGRVNRTSLPSAVPVAKARVDSAVRALADDASQTLPRQWQAAVANAARTEEAVLPDRLDRAIASADLEVRTGTGWWSVVRVLQWLVMIAMVVGLGWLALNFVLVAYMALPALPVPMIGRLGLPTWLALGGFVLGLVIAGLSRIGVEIGARAAARRAESVLERAIAEVTADAVADPVNAELARYERAREALASLR